MYHYVREDNPNTPYSKHKKINDFKYECNFFKKNNCFFSLSDSLKKGNFKENSISLTFDDGLKDHLNVAEILKSLDINATFYIPIYPYTNNQILDVHKAHLICSKVGPESLDLLNIACKKLEINNLLNYREKEKFENKYFNQIDNDNIKIFKKIINYYGHMNLRTNILDFILKMINIPIDPSYFYLSKDELIYINSLGFEIGSHGVSHTLLSRLNKLQQKKELENSKIFLEDLLKKRIDSFCYPYGTKNSYDDTTILLLKEIGYLNAVSVESRDVSMNDFKNKNYEIPRYDCNEIENIYLLKKSS